MAIHRAVVHSARRTLALTQVFRCVPVVSLVLFLFWTYTLYHGERGIYTKRIGACAWDTWESLPEGANPHHLVLIADPQLVDPHTYPGRPWPLDVLTERYTDLYMRRSFRLTNANLDPDSIIFLGDLFDGGREWSTSRTTSPVAEKRGLCERDGICNMEKMEHSDAANNNDKPLEHRHQSKTDHASEQQSNFQRGALLERDPGSSEFVHGEHGRWAHLGMEQWYSEFRRFGSIFLAPQQLYPRSGRRLLASSRTRPHAASLDNGAEDMDSHEYAVVGGKQRQIIVNLPGNHDLGFGSGVQLSVRQRFWSNFGDPNSLYSLGNFTFINLDTPSLSAYSEFTLNGETSVEMRAKLRHIWGPAYEFLEDIETLAEDVTSTAIAQYYPKMLPDSAPQSHEVVTASRRDQSESQAFEDTVGRKTSLHISQLPVILLSHVPFYRDQGTDCGPQREKGRSIHVSAGYQYQNVLTRELSALIADKIHDQLGDILHVFSGDDHDYCDVVLSYTDVPRLGRPASQPRAFKDITVKSFSWAMGVRKPGFLLVSLWNPIDESGASTDGGPIIQTRLCILPDQLSIFIEYGLLCACTIVVLLANAIIRGKHKTRGEREASSAPCLLPRFQTEMPLSRLDQKVNDWSSREELVHGRHRASSTSTSAHNGTSSSLGVQRSFNARTRSVSPGPGAIVSGLLSQYIGSQQSTDRPSLTKPLISPTSSTMSGQMPVDFADIESQSQTKDTDENDESASFLDSQNKRDRRQQRGWIRVAFWEFWTSFIFVAIPSALLYAFLLQTT